MIKISALIFNIKLIIRELKKILLIILFNVHFSIAQDIIVKDNVFSPYSWTTYYAVKRTMPITVDGNLSEWHTIKGVTMDQERFFFIGQGMSSARWKGASDLSGTFKLIWDSKYIYIAVEVIDDIVCEPHGSLIDGTGFGSWDDDGIEIMFDNDGCGMSKYYIGDSLHHEFHFVYSRNKPFVFDNFWQSKSGAPQLMYKLPNGEEEPMGYPNEVLEKNDVTSNFSEPPYNGTYAFKKTEDGYNFELKMSLPGAKMVAINEGGHKIGFDICINDNDNGEGPLKQQMHWSGMNGMFWRNCQFFGTLILINK